MSPLVVIALGFFLGMRHATDADHVVAVATLVSRERHFGHAAEACGVSLSLSWLLDGSWRWPTLPTRHWIAWQRFVDATIRHDDRWERLPPPADVARLILAQRVRLRAGRHGILRLDPAERPGVILKVAEGSPALERLRRGGLPLSFLAPGAAFLPTPVFISAIKAIFFALLFLLFSWLSLSKSLGRRA